jgi:hypothetical protein
MKAVKSNKKNQEKRGIKPDHKTNEDFNQQEPRLATPTSKADKQQLPVYNKKENTSSHNHPTKANAQVVVNDQNREDEEGALETKKGDADAELSEKEESN